MIHKIIAVSLEEISQTTFDFWLFSLHIWTQDSETERYKDRNGQRAILGKGVSGSHIYVDPADLSLDFLIFLLRCCSADAPPTHNVNYLRGAFRNSWNKSTDSSFKFNSLWVTSIARGALWHISEPVLYYSFFTQVREFFFHKYLCFDWSEECVCSCHLCYFTAFNKSISRRSRQLF